MLSVIVSSSMVIHRVATPAGLGMNMSVSKLAAAKRFCKVGGAGVAREAFPASRPAALGPDLKAVWGAAMVKGEAAMSSRVRVLELLTVIVSRPNFALISLSRAASKRTSGRPVGDSRCWCCRLRLPGWDRSGRQCSRLGVLLLAQRFLVLGVDGQSPLLDRLLNQLFGGVDDEDRAGITDTEADLRPSSSGA